MKKLLRPAVLIGCFVSLPLIAAIQPAWIARYSPGLPSSTNVAVAIALDSQGNAILTGSSTGANGDFDYVTLKYAPGGARLWLARYASLRNGNDQLRALAVDGDGNVFITGTSATVKYSANGVQHWDAPYSGRGLALDTNGNAYVTGYSTEDFATVKLNASGSNVWERIHDQVGQRDISDAVDVDADGNVYVAGRESWMPDYFDSRLAVIKYDSAGGVLWTNFLPPTSVRAFDLLTETTVKRIAFRTDGFLYLVANLWGAGGLTYYSVRLQAATGQLDWKTFPETTSLEGATAGLVDGIGNSYLTGRLTRRLSEFVSYATFKVNPTGAVTWEASYSSQDSGYHIANAIALDPAGNVYVTGRSVSPDGDDDWATIKYNGEGKEQWVRRHDGPAHERDEANAIAVDASGNVYVAGSQTTTNGLVELVVIKYSDLENIRVQPDNQVALHFFATPGQLCRFQATTNFPNWADLGSSTAGADGIARFTDTNALGYPHRFYRFVSP